MNKTLNSIQKISKIGKVISIIVLVCAIIGMVCCAIAATVLITMGNVIIETPEIREMFENAMNETDLSAKEFAMELNRIAAIVIVGFISCLAEVILSNGAVKYFKFELAEGTPFTFAGAKKLKKLGILNIVLSVVCAIIATFVVEIVFNRSVLFGSDSVNINYYSSIGVGIMMLIFALIFKHGAEIVEKQKSTQVQAPQTIDRNGFYY